MSGTNSAMPSCRCRAAEVVASITVWWVSHLVQSLWLPSGLRSRSCCPAALLGFLLRLVVSLVLLLVSLRQ